MDIFLVSLLGIVLLGLLSFKFQTSESRFEINRLAEHNHKYKILSKFLEVYPGLLAMVHILALLFAVLLTGFSVISWGILSGGLAAFIVIVAAWLLSQLVHGFANKIIGQRLDFFIKYFSWVKPLGRLVAVGEDPSIGSESELMHLIEHGDFLDDSTKSLIKNSIGFNSKTVKSVMTARANIGFIHSRDNLTPKLIDELFSSGYKIFPVIQNSIDHTVGLLYLDDILPIEQDEKELADVMRKVPPMIDQTAPLESAMRQMAEYHSPVLLVEKEGKVVGLITMTDVVRELFKVE